MAYDDAKLLDIVNGQGYLLQQTIEQQVRSRPKSVYGDSDWRVLSSEHYWQHPTVERRGYIDLVIEHHNGIVGVVECKRVGEDTPWIFLCPKDESNETMLSAMNWGYVDRGHVNNRKGLSDFNHKPPSSQVRFCVVPGQANDRAMLERVAGDLLYAVEALAAQHISIPASTSGGICFLPIIVTTAQLHVCTYDPQTIDPAKGELSPSNATFAKAPYIRFHKVFTETDVDLSSVESLGAIEKKQRQTVMVVQASALSEFLSECDAPTVPKHSKWPWPT